MQSTRALSALVLAVSACLLSSTSAAAATIMVQSTSDDTVGRSLVYELRNEITRSGRHSVVFTRDDAGFVINIVTLKDNEGRTTVYAASLLMPPFDKEGLSYFVTSIAGFCGANVTASCAKEVLGSFDTDMSKIAQTLSEALKPE